MFLYDLKIQENQASQRIQEKGSIIFWIFIMIFLFAMLSFIMSDGLRTGEATLSNEKQRLIATEIVDYARSVRSAVQTLRINGCSDTDISFENGIVAGYSASSVTDGSCDVFASAGGNAKVEQIPEEVRVSSHPYYIFNGDDAITNVGTALPELTLKARVSTEQICTKINELVDLDGAPTHTDITLTLFGGYTAAQTIDMLNAINGCVTITGGSNPGNYYIHTLIER